MFHKMISSINNYQKMGLACLLLSGIAYYFLHSTPYGFLTGGIAGCGIGLLLTRNKPQKMSRSTNAQYKSQFKQKGN